MNAVKDLLKSGQTVVGAAGSIYGDMTMLGDSGFDFLCSIRSTRQLKLSS